MRMIKITAPTMQEALDRVRAEIGPDAVILSIKGPSRKGLFRFFGRRQVEITVAADRQSAWTRRTRQTGSRRSDSFQPDPRQPDRGLAGLIGDASETEDGRTLEDIRSEIAGIKEAIDEMMRRSDSDRDREPILPGSFFEAYNHLVDNGFESGIAELILDEVKERMSPAEYGDIAKIRNLVKGYIRGLIPVSGPIHIEKGRRRIVALVGPTGVGKTTTIAKLAATYSLKMKKEVGLITTDTYRIAALEQLTTYAKIIGVPVEVVYTPGDMTRSLKALASCDLILMDTPGRNPRNPLKIKELVDLIKSGNPDEVHLVISATTRDVEAVDLIERFKPVGFDKLIFTKVDESIAYGMLLNVLIKAKCPISYLGTGQSVPQDYIVADQGSIAEMIVGDWGDRLTGLG